MILVIGAGYIAQHILKEAGQSSVQALVTSRRGTADGLQKHWTRLDATDFDAVARLIEATQPSAIVLVHGPSDITWCENNADECHRIHLTIARNIVKAAPAQTHLVLISTDNVFDGRQASYGEDDGPAPHNAYGRAKLAAEDVLRSAVHKTTVLRTSLVYGLNEPEREWHNFFSQVHEAVRANEALVVPVGLWTTPIWVEDVARVVLRVVEFNCHGVYHLAGPERIARDAWCTVIASAMGRPKPMFVFTDAAFTRYACRPKSACLHHVEGHAGGVGLFSELTRDVIGASQASTVLGGFIQ